MVACRIVLICDNGSPLPTVGYIVATLEIGHAILLASVELTRPVQASTVWSGALARSGAAVARSLGCGPPGLTAYEINPTWNGPTTNHQPLALGNSGAQSCNRSLSGLSSPFPTRFPHNPVDMALIQKLRLSTQTEAVKATPSSALHCLVLYYCTFSA
jgi:hypothetical protein